MTNSAPTSRPGTLSNLLPEWASCVDDGEVEELNPLCVKAVKPLDRPIEGHRPVTPARDHEPT